MSCFHPADLISIRDKGWLVAIKIQSGSIDVTELLSELIQDYRAFIFALLWNLAAIGRALLILWNMHTTVFWAVLIFLDSKVTWPTWDHLGPVSPS